MEGESKGKQCQILTIPDEVLRLIIDKASEPMSPKDHPNYIALPPYSDLVYLALACRRFNAIATESLYSCICLHTDDGDDDDLYWERNQDDDNDSEDHCDRRLSTYAQCVRLYLTL
ncbi:uncharacterized protein BKA55DRAFT_688999 [Fusarium redolens]|uniref:F-box domain-containing protein n=1 Tax=Fusarium redolens TaxID=48865 RepID=A0A9P9H9P1_FUSRE|nr:uncharacterized protein BKA55DRAFT_688999 [Fusarium redolens]KAH7253503.1 hypothetical protein BKA55DRAFT_688999 [Fusarium redolens]